MCRFRPFLFWLFVLLFLSTTSSVLFYTFGYRFNFERGIFIYTGSVSIKSTPEKVDITVDKELIPEKKLGILNRSIHIGGLTPGEHFIKVSAPGYSTWTKKITIQSGLSTEFWNVLLTKENVITEVIPDTAYVTKIFQSREKGIFAVTKEKDGVFSVDILDTNAHTINEVFSLARASLPLDETENIEWSPDDKNLLIPTEQSGLRTYFIVDITTKKVSSLSDIIQIKSNSTLRSPRFDPANRDFLLYMSESILYRINIATTEPKPFVIKENIRDYNFSGQDIYYLSNDNGIIYHISGNLVPNEPTQVTTLSLDLLPDSLYSLILYDDTRLTVREQKTGKLWIYNKITSDQTILKEIAEKDVKNIQFSDDGKKLLFFTNNEISVYFVRDWETQPIRTYNTTLQIARFSNPLRNIVWTEDYEHILFSLGNTVKMIELDNRDKRNITDIATFPVPLSQVLPRFDENFIYFVTNINGESDTVSRIQSSQKTSILGF